MTRSWSRHLAWGCVALCLLHACQAENVTFLVSAGNVTVDDLAPHHDSILGAVATAVGTAASSVALGSVTDSGQHAVNLQLIVSDIAEGDVSAVSQQSDAVALAVKDAVNAAVGGEAVCASKAAAVVASGAEQVVYC